MIPPDAGSYGLPMKLWRMLSLIRVRNFIQGPYPHYESGESARNAGTGSVGVIDFPVQGIVVNFDPLTRTLLWSTAKMKTL